MFVRLRPWARAEACAAPYSIEAAARVARWAFTLEDDDGEFVASMCIVHDGPRRGWFSSFPGASIKSAGQLRPLFRMFRAFTESGACYDELRAWVCPDDKQAVRFAEWFGFELDCGPATGLSPTGRDMCLYIWRLNK